MYYNEVNKFGLDESVNICMDQRQQFRVHFMEIQFQRNTGF